MPKVPVEYKNHPQPPSRNNPESRKAEYLSSWRRGPSDLPKLAGRLANVSRWDVEELRKFKECLERAGNAAALDFERDIRIRIPLANLTRTICDIILEGYCEAWHNRVPDRAPPLNPENILDVYGPYIQSEASATYRFLGQRITAHVYWFMWKAIGEIRQWPPDCFNSGNFEETFQVYAKLTSAARSECDKACAIAINAANRCAAYSFLHQAAPDFWDASALEAVLGGSGEPTSLRLAMLDVAGERHEWETVGELAKEVGIVTSKEDQASIVWTTEIIHERRWWESPVPVNYINAAAAKDRVDREKAECFETDKAALAFAEQGLPQKVFSLDQPGSPDLPCTEEVIGRVESTGAEERERLLDKFRGYLRADAREFFDLQRAGLKPRNILRERGWSEARIDAAKKSYNRTASRVQLILKNRPLKGPLGSNRGVFKEYLDPPPPSKLTGNPNGPLTTGRPWTYALVPPMTQAEKSTSKK